MEGDAGVKSRSMPHDINLESFHYTFPRYYVRNEKYYLKKYFVPTIIEIYFESSLSSIFEDKIFNLRSRLLSSEKVHTHHPIPPLFLLTIHCIERSKPISPLLFPKLSHFLSRSIAKINTLITTNWQVGFDTDVETLHTLFFPG